MDGKSKTITKDNWYIEYLTACSLVASECPNGFAVAYAAQGKEIGMDEEAVDTQILYILGNIKHWRGAAATNARSMLKNVRTWIVSHPAEQQ